MAIRKVDLDEATCGVLAELETGRNQAIQQAAAPFVQQMNVVLTLFLRQQKLDGNWRLTPDGKSVESADEAAAPNVAQKSVRKRK